MEKKLAGTHNLSIVVKEDFFLKKKKKRVSNHKIIIGEAKPPSPECIRYRSF